MVKILITGWLLLASTGHCEAQTGSRYPMTSKNRQIIVGEGGGFTGGSRAYYLLESGYLYVKSDTDSLFTPLGRKSAATTRRLFKQLESTCRIKTTHFQEPGNRYRFVAWKKGPQEFRVTWGDRQKPPPDRFTTFYQSFMAQVPAPK
ncbi:FAD-binding oxidoreductase [Larkinella bovis]|uniref:FAD-binding oxidoreductase n=1 Tax=Larkinella bovis TaxID=683041 RepID=A0ABW0I4N7_9BACT